MTDHNPPPAPDWVLGDDGHWRPPPFTTGSSARPAPLPGSGAAAPVPGPDAAGWPWNTGGAAPAPPPPRRAGSPAAIVGGLVVAAVLVVGVLVVTVTFLGTTPDASERIAGSEPARGFSSDDDDDRAADPTTTAPVTTTPPQEGAEAVAQVAATRVVADADWVVSATDQPSLDEVPGCVVDGLMTGATERFRVSFGRLSTGSPEALTLSITTYVDDASALAELDRVRSDQYAACEESERLAEVSLPPESATVVEMPADPLAPGVTLEIALVDADPLTEYEFTVVVGHVRAHLDFCGCSDLGLEGQQAIARQVAAALADAQGLPALS